MNRNVVTLAAWISFASVAFGLGWVLKSATRSPDESPESGPAGHPHTVSSKTHQPSSASANATGKRAALPAGVAGPAAEGRPGARVVSSRLGSTASSGRPALTLFAIETLGRRLKNELDPVKRRLLFAQLLEGMTPENAELIREQIAHLPPHSREFLDFHQAWGQIAGEMGVMKGADTLEPDMGPLLAGWATEEPNAAIDWFNNLDMKNDARFDGLLNERKIPEEVLHNYLMKGMVHGLSETDLGLATSFVNQLAESGESRAGELYAMLAGKALETGGPAEAANWAAENLPPGDASAGAMRRIAGEYAKSDPAAASQYLSEMRPSPNRDAAVTGYVDSQRWRDPVTAIEWAGTISNPTVRERSMVSAAQAYYVRDRENASQWLPNSGLSAEAQQKVVNSAEEIRNRSNAAGSSDHRE